MSVATPLRGRIETTIHWLAKGWAIIGGMVLAAMALITAASILGRSLTGIGLRPITGDFELVEMGCAIAVFSFLPWCQLNRNHVSVDLLARLFPARVFAFLGAMGDIAICLCSGVIFWRMWLGFIEKFPHGSESVRETLGLGPAPFFPETSYELQIPVWIPFGLAMIGAALFFVVSAFTVWRSLGWVRMGAEPSNEAPQ